MIKKRKVATLKDIAADVGVSVATVSYVLNDTHNSVSAETREKVLEAAKKLNYRTNRIAKGLKTSEYNNIAVVVEDMRSFFMPTMIDGVCQYAEENDYDVTLINLRMDNKTRVEIAYKLDEYASWIIKKIENTVQNQVKGIIYAGAFYRDLGNLLVEHFDLPVTYLYCYSSADHSHSSVYYDDKSAAHCATEYLLKKGHRRIGHICGAPHSDPGRDRLEGFYQALEDYGIEPDLSLVEYTDFSKTMAFDAAVRMLSRADRPSAVFAASDIISKGIYEACAQLKLKIPEDVSIVSFDNAQFSEMLTPPLTTMAIPSHEMGYRAMELLLREENKTVRLKCPLIERKSVRDASAAQ